MLAAFIQGRLASSSNCVSAALRSAGCTENVLLLPLRVLFRSSSTRRNSGSGSSAGRNGAEAEASEGEELWVVKLSSRCWLRRAEFFRCVPAIVYESGDSPVLFELHGAEAPPEVWFVLQRCLVTEAWLIILLDFYVLI